MSDRDHYHQNYHRSSNTNNTNRDSPSARRASASSSTSYNGGGHSGKTMPAATMRNSSPSSAVSPSAVAGLSEDLAHLNLPAEVTVGSTVQCTLTLAQTTRIFKGEVVAFDPTVKAIILSKFAWFSSLRPLFSISCHFSDVKLTTEIFSKVGADR